MELFSLESLNVAKEMNIEVIVDINILKNIDNPIKFMKSNNFKFVSISQSSKNKLINNISNKIRNLFSKSVEKKLLENDIKFIVYGLNDKKNVSENDIICKYSDIFYGMYADKWDFTENIDCN
tara:strand:- start:120 stop:488 length:369 start_codon:yes stop_codon:yes gene_type:complete